ncbi:hypothetical protein M0804_000220 [Polistes exclamans]|nr:hypothetical protein M0804_000220 [Polistes exclamans]
MLQEQNGQTASIWARTTYHTFFKKSILNSMSSSIVFGKTLCCKDSIEWKNPKSRSFKSFYLFLLICAYSVRIKKYRTVEEKEEEQPAAVAGLGGE